jgi:caffeoyl-CoA O-methyltransferase
MADDSSRTGARYATREILRYVEELHATHDEPLARAFAAPAAEEMPAIMLGPSEARLLELLLRLVGAVKVVEVGTLAGYSAIRMARALPEDGRVWSIEVNPAHAAVARDNLAAAGVADRVEVLCGAAADLLPDLAAEAPFDAVFIDADKEGYDGYGAWAERHLRPGGLLLADNAYLFGRLTEDSDEARAMRRFHERSRDSFHTVCIPTPDGLLLGIKK